MILAAENHFVHEIIIHFLLFNNVVQLVNFLCLLAVLVYSITFCNHRDPNIQWQYGEEWQLKRSVLVYADKIELSGLSVKLSRTAAMFVLKRPLRARVINHWNRRSTFLITVFTVDEFAKIKLSLGIVVNPF